MINKKNNFWFKLSSDLVWKKKPLELYLKSKLNNYSWFPDGLLNIYENTVIKNLNNKNKAIITVGLDCKINTYTYSELNELVDSLSIFLEAKTDKIKKPKILIHSSASIYSAISMLACAKLGIHFSVIFEDLEYLAISNRIKLFKPDIILTSFPTKKFKKRFPKEFISKKKIFYLKDINLTKRSLKKKEIIHFPGGKDFFT